MPADRPDDKGDATSFLRCHPLTKERAEAIRKLAGPVETGRRILLDEDWTSLERICPGKPAETKQTLSTNL